jgi:hypothetical protein
MVEQSKKKTLLVEECKNNIRNEKTFNIGIWKIKLVIN